jgi:hypothetical protein
MWMEMEEWSSVSRSRPSDLQKEEKWGRLVNWASDNSEEHVTLTSGELLYRRLRETDLSITSAEELSVSPMEKCR